MLWPNAFISLLLLINMCSKFHCNAHLSACLVLQSGSRLDRSEKKRSVELNYEVEEGEKGLCQGQSCLVLSNLRAQLGCTLHTNGLAKSVRQGETTSLPTEDAKASSAQWRSVKTRKIATCARQTCFSLFSPTDSSNSCRFLFVRFERRGFF